MNTGASEAIALCPTDGPGLLRRTALRLATAFHRACRQYSERLVNDAIPIAPLGGHDWFLDLENAR